MDPQFVIEYFFTSTRADGDDYSRHVYVNAKSRKSAEATAHLTGFEQFGARFNDNCFDWKVRAA